MLDFINQILAALRRKESGSYNGNYSAQQGWGGSSASGAYQITDGTWNRYGGYSHAYQAPKAIQDQFAYNEVSRLYKHYGTVDDVFGAWFVGEKTLNKYGSTSGYVPPHNKESIRDYVDSAKKFFRPSVDLQQQPDRSYLKMTPAEPPPLNVPSRADQKKNVFTKAFDPRQRKIIVLLIAGFLLFLAAIHAE